MSNLTEQELKTIAMYVADEMRGHGGSQTSGQVLNSVRNIYMNGVFMDLFGFNIRHRAWENILQLTKNILGVNRIFDLETKDVDFAKYVANELSKQAVKFRNEFLSKENEEVEIWPDLT